MTESGGLLDPLAHGTRAAELTGDAAFLSAMVEAELSLTLALVDTGLAPTWMTEVCAGLSDASRFDLPAIAAAGRGGGNPVIPLVSALRERADDIHPGAADHLHVGATSQDIIDTAMMLVATRVIDEVLSGLGTIAERFAELADDHRDTLMVGRTLGQHAAPTTFGFVVAGWLDAVLNAREVLERVARSLPVQLGGSVGTLAVLTAVASARRPDAAGVADEIVDRMAERLGLARPPISWHTDRVVITALASALATVTGVVGAFALDVTVLSRTEIQELAERTTAGGGGSSAMPHKQNPVTAVLITAAARRAPGLLATCFSSLGAEDQRPSGAWHAEWMALRELEALAVASVSAAADLAGRLAVDAERMRANLGMTGGLVLSERVTAVLAEQLGRTAAFAVVGAAADRAMQTRTPFPAVLADVIRDDSRVTTDAAALQDRVSACFALDGAADSDLASTITAIDRVLARHRGASAAASGSPS